MTNFDVTRATAIINRAMEGGWYESGRMPESDSDKIVEAEKIVQIAEQHWTAIEQWILSSGGNDLSESTTQKFLDDKNINWKTPEAILMEAQVFVGSNDQNGASPKEEPSEQQSQQEIVPPTPAPSISVDPKAGEVWTDNHGQEILVVSYHGGQMAEVQYLPNTEITVVPAGTLKVKIRDFQNDDRQADDRDEEIESEDIIIASGESEISQVDVSVQSVPSLPEKALETLPIPDHDDEGDEEYRSVLQKVEDRYTPSGMPIPRDLVNPPASIPENLDDIPDRVAQQLHLQYHALAARAKYLHDYEDAIVRGCKMMLKILMRPAMKEAKKALGASSTITERQAWAEEENERIVTWQERANEHAEEASAYSTFAEIYMNQVAALSRDESFRARQLQSRQA